jgi:hypothetical protein
LKFVFGVLGGPVRSVWVFWVCVGFVKDSVLVFSNWGRVFLSFGLGFLRPHRLWQILFGFVFKFVWLPTRFPNSPLRVLKFFRNPPCVVTNS